MRGLRSRQTRRFVLKQGGRLAYATGDCVVIGVDVPVVGQVTTASPDQPYIAIVLDLDVPLLLDVAREAKIADHAAAEESSFFGLFHASLSERAVNALARLIGLLATPGAVSVLSRSIIRELYYWLLVGRSGAKLARLAMPGGYVDRMASAIRYMREAFPGSVRLEDLAGGGAHGSLLLPCALRSRYPARAHSILQALALARSAPPSYVGRGGERSGSGLPSGLRKRLSIQSGVCARVRDPARA